MNEFEILQQGIVHIITLIRPNKFENIKELIKSGIEKNELDDKEQINIKYINLEYSEMEVKNKRSRDKGDIFIFGELEFEFSQETFAQNHEHKQY
jgi:hydroxymethylpyrimidine/phosphomethylpyrimidine kinase